MFPPALAALELTDIFSDLVLGAFVAFADATFSALASAVLDDLAFDDLALCSVLAKSGSEEEDGKQDKSSSHRV